ncbi:uncharacterized protein LOC141905961 [Tubulanus polymorphus]|uniref:uncharacterized protein LOC141905961 n=1 Tax=Tubulanus polymorphus TaxID=672921 RepID=UPI003DA63AD1
MSRSPVYNVFLTEGSREPSMSVDSGFADETDYTKALNNLRKIISDIEADIYRLKTHFYMVGEESMLTTVWVETDKSPYSAIGSDDTNDQPVYKEREYLKTVSDQFIKCSDILLVNSVEPELINSESKILTMLNNLRMCQGDPKPDQKSLAFITEFWENLKNSLDEANSLKNKFKTRVFRRLKRGCLSGSLDESSVELSEKYREETFKFMGDLSTEIMEVQILIKSFNHGIKANLFRQNDVKLDGLMNGCEWDCFPVVRIFPEVVSKLECMCAISRDWVNRDQTYVNEINLHIAEVRSLSLKKAENLRHQRSTKIKTADALKTAQASCEANKNKLRKMETDLVVLEQQLLIFQREKHNKSVELQQKESMADFLKISISQLKRNYSLQSKRSKILNQLRYLDNQLTDVGKQFSNAEKNYNTKESERQRLLEISAESENSYAQLKAELDGLTSDVNSLETEFSELHGTLEKLEAVHNVKTSPEIVEDFYEEKSPVQLAQSLQNAIINKRRMSLPGKAVKSRAASRRNSHKHNILESINTSIEQHRSTSEEPELPSESVSQIVDEPQSPKIKPKPKLSRQQHARFMGSRKSIPTANSIARAKTPVRFKWV